MRRTASQLRDKALVSPFLLAGILFADVSSAEESFLQAIHPYVELGMGYDSNVFRVQNVAQAGELIDGSDASDSYWSVETGFAGQLTHQRQKFRLRGRVFHNDYDQFDQVDFTGGDAKVAWDWAAGDLWNGELGYEFRRAMRDFANQLTPSIDISSSNRIEGSVARRFGNNWRLTADANLTDTEFSRENFLDLRRTGSGLSLAYASRKDNIVSLDASYTVKESNGTANLDYTEFLLGPAMDWHLSDSSRIQAELGYMARDQDDPALHDFGGFVGRISGEWTTSRANSIRISLWHELSNLGDEIATFAIVTGASIDPTFQIGNRAFVSFGIGYEARDFRGEPELPSQSLSHRDDELLTGTLRLEWRLNENSNLSCEYRTESRDSNRTGRDYDFDLVQLNFRLGL